MLGRKEEKLLNLRQEKTTVAVTVPQAEANQRLDRFLSRFFPAASFAHVQKLCRKGFIKQNGTKVKDSKTAVMAGDELVLPLSLCAPDSDEKPNQKNISLQLSAAEKAQIASQILYEDDAILVLNKPYGVPVQAGSGHVKSIDRLLAAFYGEEQAPRLVHRLDKDTTGCLLLAKTREVANTLTHNFRTRDMEKTYWCVCRGRLALPEGVCTMRLQKEGGKGSEKVVIHPEGQTASTYYRKMDSGADLLWVEAKPKTGRTHQIRVHMNYLDCPLIGDVKYGGEKAKAGQELPRNKMFLHARKIAFLHPITQRPIEVEAPLPQHFADVFKLMGWREAEAQNA